MQGILTGRFDTVTGYRLRHSQQIHTWLVLRNYKTKIKQQTPKNIIIRHDLILTDQHKCKINHAYMRGKGKKALQKAKLGCMKILQ